MKHLILSIAAALSIGTVAAQTYWQVDSTANSITWQVKSGQEHSDHIEMAGKRMATVLRYGVDKNGAFTINKSMVWPMLRTLPNNTHASLMRRYDWNPLATATANGWPLRERVLHISLDGTLETVSLLTPGKDCRMMLKRTFLPSTEHPSLVEIYEFTNTGSKVIYLEIPSVHTVQPTCPENGVDGSYDIEFRTYGATPVALQPGKTYRFSASISGYKASEPKVEIKADEELAARRKQVEEWTGNLVLETPDPVIDRMFSFSKIRACESIYETKGGPMHGPGGESYYAAIWANDQAEYINPYFPYTGYAYGNASALNAFRHFARYMNDGWRPIPSSIIAEGESYWNGAGDRGDAAMIAYGAARYALASGSREESEQLWPLIEWCLEYSRRKLNEGGVVASDADELEHRFPSGEANLCTSSLYYDALLSAAYLAEDLGKGKQTARTYRQQAATLKQNIDRYFSSTVEGFDTYAYYEGNDILRSWICIPLTVGINTRAQGTIAALFSPRLWSENGLLTQAGSQTFWDRSTLYALRGVYMAGETEKATDFLRKYSATRLLGEHVPYAVEAWPEGGQRHLSAESALYGRIITEGLFGIRPTGLHTFSTSPRLPQTWDHMSLRRIKAFGATFDIEVRRAGKQQLSVRITEDGRTILNKKIKEGTSITCKV